MAYSRYGGRGSGIWYTYWCVTESPYRDDQIFEVSIGRPFIYKELKENINKCLKEVKIYADKNFNIPCTKEHIEELKTYMLEFMRDVETDDRIIEAELIKNTSRKDLPLLISQIKTEKSITLLTQRLKGN